MNVPFLQDSTFTGLVSTQSYGTSREWFRAYSLVQSNSANWNISAYSLWGSISGTLSAQTDLWKYLSAINTSNLDISTFTNYFSTTPILLSSLNVNGQILSAGIPLHNIFLTSETDSQTLSYTASSYLLSISSGNTINLSSINSIFTSNSSKYESVYSDVQSNSANWNTAYNISTAYSLTSSTFATNTDLNLYKTNVALATATLLPTSVYQNASSNWQSTYITVSSLSGLWGTTSGIFGNIQLLTNSQTVLSANIFSSFYKTVTANNLFTFTGLTSGLTITVYLSGKHNIPYRQYFPANTYFNNNGQANYVYTFPNKITKAVIQNIGDKNIGITNIITTDVPSVTSTGNIILDGLFGLLLAENRTVIRQEPI